METIFIICRTEAQKRFWNGQKTGSNTQVIAWKNVSHAIQNLHTALPHTIIVDDYFSKDTEGVWMNKVVEMVKKESFKGQMFGISPRFSVFEQANQFQFNPTTISKEIIQTVRLAG